MKIEAEVELIESDPSVSVCDLCCFYGIDPCPSEECGSAGYFEIIEYKVRNEN